ncbi:MAG TPA: response regulator [Bacteroidetes bacterium]|nr:response regulator [Bacteroidota bacterium]
MNKKKTVFVVDDDPDYLFQTVVHLEKAGYNVISAVSQKEAEDIIDTVKPDIALLDLMMEQDDSGFILCYKLKKKYPDLPVIIATSVSKETGLSFGLDSEEERRWIKADAYLEKGVRAEQLNDEIKRLLKI